LAQFPSAKLHRQERRDRKNIASDVSCTHASISGRSKSRLKQITHLFRVGWGAAARIELFNRLERGKSLRRNVVHGIKVLYANKAKRIATSAVVTAAGCLRIDEKASKPPMMMT
jgi:hypothetical protein